MTSLSKNVFNVKSDTRLLNYQGGPIINSREAEDVWKRQYQNGVRSETIDPSWPISYAFGQRNNDVATMRINFGLGKKPFFLYAVTDEKAKKEWKQWNGAIRRAYDDVYQAGIVPLVGKWSKPNGVGVLPGQINIYLEISRIDERKKEIVIEEHKRLWEEEEAFGLEDSQIQSQVPQIAIILISNEEDPEDHAADATIERGVYQINIHDQKDPTSYDWSKREVIP